MTIENEFDCPICLDRMKDVAFICVKDCHHRFCRECLEKIVHSSNKQAKCPNCRQPFDSKDIRIDRFLKQLMQKIENQILAEKIDKSLNNFSEKENFVSRKIHEQEMSCLKAEISQLKNELSEIKLAYTKELEKQLNKKKIMQENENLKKKNVKLQNDLQIMRNKVKKIAENEIENEKLKKDLVEIQTKFSYSEAEKGHLKITQNEKIRLLERNSKENLELKEKNISDLRCLMDTLQLRYQNLSSETEKLRKIREDDKVLLKETSG